MAKSSFLICKNSPKKAFYNLVLTGNKVLKVSGNTHPEKLIMDKRVYTFDDPGKAENFFDSKIKQKRGPKRKRVYQEIELASC